ncbi:MAG: hypothetical protein KDN20_17565 [Verrucomicrobiae bacterium]|nr:hypothetical protein [Verrucomicrobiae bacterium]
MAITLVSDYSKKLGLPGFSSHQFSVSIQTELTDLERVPGEVARLYQLLQNAVDREIQETGFVPGHDYGEVSPGKGNGSHPNGNPNNGVSRLPLNQGVDTSWRCSDKQRQLLDNLTEELQLSEADLDRRSQRLFQLPAHQLNKLAASGLISDLLAEAGTRRQRTGGTNGGARGNGSNQRHLPTTAGRNGGGA